MADNKGNLTTGRLSVAIRVSVRIIFLAASKLILQESLVKLVFSMESSDLVDLLNKQYLK